MSPENIFIEKLIQNFHNNGVNTFDFTDEDLKRLVRIGMDRARKCGLTLESSIARFIGLMFVIAPNFDAHPLAEKIWESSELPPDQRVELYYSLLNLEQMREISEDPIASAWETFDYQYTDFFEAKNHNEAEMIISLLYDHNIASNSLANLEGADLQSKDFNILAHPYKISVHEKDAEEAKKILKNHKICNF